MRKAIVAFVFAVLMLAATSVSWGQTVSPDSATWETTPFDLLTIWQ